MCGSRGVALGYGQGQGAGQYADNYGYGSASKPSTIAQEERQWYIDNKFGDPTKIVGQYSGDTGKFASIARPSAGFYKGVSPEAHYLYTQSSIPKTVYKEERAPGALPAGAARTVASTPANTRWAGNALSIKTPTK